MEKILVTYATMAGSTADVANAIAEEIGKQGWAVDVRPLTEVDDLDPYSAVVLGAPMIMGWHRAALRFLRRWRQALRQKPLACFVLAMSLTGEPSTSEVDGVPVQIDEKLPKAPADPQHLSRRERYSRVSNYLRPILRQAKPKSIGVFGGRMEYGRLRWWAVLFAMVIIKAPAGDKRNWTTIRGWAATLPAALGLRA